MKLSDILENHRKNCHSKGLPNNIGDGFLCRHNKVYKNIRSAALARGFRYNGNPDHAFFAYPLGQLERILQSKKIPYVDNVGVVIDLVDQLGDRVIWDEIVDGFKRNFVFHESCHAVARTEMRSLFKNTDESTLSPQQRKCLQIILEESFANTCEFWGSLYAGDPFHRFFYKANSYGFTTQHRIHLEHAIDQFGEEFVFKFLLFSYIAANFLKDSLDANQFRQIMKFLSIGKPKDLKSLKALAKVPFTLDFRFRVVTTGLHFKLSGLNKNMSELLKFDFFEILLVEKKYSDLIHKLTKIALGKSG